MRRDRIRAQPRSFYADLLERLNSIPPQEPAPAFALEHSWHAIFVSALCRQEETLSASLLQHWHLSPFEVPTRLHPRNPASASASCTQNTQYATLQGEPWVTLGIGKCQLIHCR